jgi:hypothetical protein
VRKAHRFLTEGPEDPFEATAPAPSLLLSRIANYQAALGLLQQSSPIELGGIRSLLCPPLTIHKPFCAKINLTLGIQLPGERLWEDRMARLAVPNGSGLRIGEIEADRFADFARRHGRSEEIGAIGTIFDEPQDRPEDGREIHALGLFGCGSLCAVSASVRTRPADGRAGAIKLDSVIVDQKPRRRGLAGLLVAKAFHFLLSDTGRPVSAI